MSSSHVLVNDGQVTRPDGVYPLNLCGNRPVPTSADSGSLVYPDFHIWKHTAQDDNRMRSHLQKGYFEPAQVRNECHSGRQVLSQLLYSVSDGKEKPNDEDPQNAATVVQAKLIRMSGAMNKAIAERHKNNRIRGKSSYKPPPRVTLTEHKRQVWLENLANCSVPLRKLSKAIPHGLRNRNLLDQCLKNWVPAFRAIWLIRCVSSNEQRQLRRKAGSSNAAALLISRWTLEWTDQVCLFLVNVYNSSFDDSHVKDWKKRLDYAIELVANLYLQSLINREAFLSWIVRYIDEAYSGNNKKQPASSTEAILHFKTIALHMHLLRLFWFRLIEIDYISKQLAEALLRVLSELQNVTSTVPAVDSLASRLGQNIQFLIKYLFYYNSDSFIIPGSWTGLKPYLRQTLDMNISVVSEQFKLITYRNESLMIDHTDQDNFGTSSTIQNSAHKNQPCYCYDHTSRLIHSLDNYHSTKPINTSGNDNSNDIHSLTKAIFIDSGSRWQESLEVALRWSVTKNREMHMSFQRISLLCSILQTRLYEASKLKPRRFNRFRLELESQILDFVYGLASILNNYYGTDESNEGDERCCPYSICSFLILINRLYRMDLLVVSTYLRRLIASGIIYLSIPDRSCYLHLLLMHSLPLSKDASVLTIMGRLSHGANVRLPAEQELQQTTKAKKWLNGFLDSLDTDSGVLPSPGKRYNSFYDLLDICQWSDIGENPIQVGRDLKLGTWLMDEMSQRLDEDTMSIRVCDLAILYRLLTRYLHRYPRFIQFIFQKVDEGKIKLVGPDCLAFLLKISMYNQTLLDSYLIDANVTVWDKVHEIVNKWSQTKGEDSHNIKRALYLCRQDVQVEQSPFAFLETVKPEILVQFSITSKERFKNSAEFSHNFNQAITIYFNIVKGFNTGLAVPALQLLRSLRLWKPEDFDNLLSIYLKKFILPTLSLDYDVDLKMIIKLTTDSLISISQVLSVAKDSDNRLVWDLLFAGSIDLTEDESLDLSFERQCYCQQDPEKYFELMHSLITPDNVFLGTSSRQDMDITGVEDVVPVDMMNSLHDLTGVPVVAPLDAAHHRDSMGSTDGIERRVNSQIVESTWQLISSYISIFVNSFYPKSGTLDSYTNSGAIQKFFFERILQCKLPTEEVSIEAINRIIERVNYYNLPICQWLFRYALEQLLGKASDGYDVGTSEIPKIVVNIIQKVSSVVPPIHAYLVGELFEFLSDDFKLKVLSACEDAFLGSDTFPRFPGHTNMQFVKCLSSIISSCSRLHQYNSGEVPMTDVNVFSLNASLEKMVTYCRTAEREKQNANDVEKILEDSIELISRIILSHKSFLVGLIMKRSMNWQKDVLLVNLVKLFRTRIMDKNLRLKNLLYDILISIKVLVSEISAKQFQKQQQQQQQQLQQLPYRPIKQGAAVSPLGKSITTPIGSFMSPTGSSPAMNEGSPQSNSLQQLMNDGKNMKPLGWHSTMSIEPPNVSNRLKSLAAKYHMKDALSTKEQKYFVVDRNTGQLVRYNFRPFDMIEDSSPHETMNNSIISLQLFDCSIDRSNPA